MNQKIKFWIYKLISTLIVLISFYSCMKKTEQTPNVTTFSVSLIKSNSASCGGSINSDGGSPISSRGVCWSVSTNPTVSDSKTTDGSGSGSFTSSITGLNPNTLYYVRAYATKNDGTTTGYGNTLSFRTQPIVGSNYEGGIIAYFLKAGDLGYDVNVQHGIIAAPYDQSSSIQWYNGSYTITGASATEIGYGASNTNMIVSSQGSGNYAAKLCSDLILGGYSDWYLPSEVELNELYKNKVVIGGFALKYYWSSSEYDYQDAWLLYFPNGGVTSNYTKRNGLCVRAVRAF